MYGAEDFPQIETMKAEGLIYLDSAATSLKHRNGIEAQYLFNKTGVSNVHRGAHRLASEATYKFEETRTKIAKFLNAGDDENIVFTKGTTEGVNLVAHHFEQQLKEDDAILITEMEHHANLVPWQEVAKKTKSQLLYIPVLENGELDYERASELFENNSIKILSVVHTSNTLGTTNSIHDLTELAHKHGAKVFVDGAQAVSSLKVDVEKLDADFYAFSAHKCFGPFGLGVLYVKTPEDLETYQTGGAMIQEVHFQESTFLVSPQKFEAGTPNIDAIVAFSKTLDFLLTLDFEKIHDYEKALLSQAQNALRQIDGFQEFGTSSEKHNILSFNFEGVHAGDLCELLDEQGLALRSGHHCTQPLLRKFGHSGCARASFSIYNTDEDVNRLVSGIKKSLELLK